MRGNFGQNESNWHFLDVPVLFSNKDVLKNDKKLSYDLAHEYDDLQIRNLPLTRSSVFLSR